MLSTKEPVSERIKILFQSFGNGNLSAFAREINVSAQAIRDLMKGEKGGPSWPVLQNILLAFPSINTDWFVFGRGPMLKKSHSPSGEVSQSDESELMTEDEARHLVQYAIDKAGSFDSFMEAFFDSIKPGLAEKVKRHYSEIGDFQNENTVYRLVGDARDHLPYGGLLAQRLGLGQKEVNNLIKSGRIKCVSIDSSDKPDSLLVTEKAVRKFLGEA